MSIPVAGNGLAALAALHACRHAGFAPLWLGGETSPQNPPVLALTASTLRQLEKWGVELGRYAPFSTLETYDEAGRRLFAIEAEEAGLDYLGAVLPSQQITKAMLQNLSQSQPQSMPPLARAQSSPHAINLVLQNGTELQAPLLIRAGQSREYKREERGRRAYSARALAGLVSHETQKKLVARQFFTAIGPLAFLPLTSEQSGFVWSLPPPQAYALEGMAANNPAFFSACLATYAPLLGELRLDGRLAAHDLAFAHKKPFAGREINLGASLRELHPLAGQGFNLALSDAAALAEILRQAHGLGLDAGGGEVLAAYARSRRLESLAFAALTDFLAQNFSHAGGFWLKTGMALFDQIGPLKNLAARAASNNILAPPVLL